MIIATSDDYDIPTIDWACKSCGAFYSSSGPPRTRCLEGHGAGWKPRPSQLESYIEFLETVEPGDGIVVCGSGPVPLMGPVESTDEQQLTTVEIDAPARTIKWDPEELVIEWGKADDDPLTFSQVYHVESVEVQCRQTPETEERIQG